MRTLKLIPGCGRAPAAKMLMPAALLIILLPSSLCGQWTGGPTGPIYYNGGNIGIGTASPNQKLVVNGVIRVNDAGGGQNGYIELENTGGWDTGLYSNTHIRFRSAADTRFLNGSGAELMRVVGATGNVGIGTTNPQYKLAVNGNIGAQDIIVTNTGWSDYVFRPGYCLRPLSEVNAFIQKHHHLPEIPTEAEVKAQGVSLWDMQAKLLAKVEELTLHLIQQEKENQELRERVAQLEPRISKRRRGTRPVR
ncbi:MAG TPA: hypothetical protein VN442_15815 [Bryobacteraceae bacterium]|nr:hypothetical protein [Bryobacteraceae bacterium]